MRGVYLYYDVIIVFVLSNIVEVVSCGRPSVNVVHRLLPTSTTAVTASTGSGLIRAATAAGRLVSETTARSARACVTQEVAAHFRFYVDRHRRHLDDDSMYDI